LNFDNGAHLFEGLGRDGERAGSEWKKWGVGDNDLTKVKI